MSQPIQLTPNQAKSTQTARELLAKAMAEVVDAVRDDSAKSPESYLSETKVPHGGE
jgi:hypothetical protein